jgi:hypothetical protein
MKNITTIITASVVILFGLVALVQFTHGVKEGLTNKNQPIITKKIMQNAIKNVQSENEKLNVGFQFSKLSDQYHEMLIAMEDWANMNMMLSLPSDMAPLDSNGMIPETEMNKIIQFNQLKNFKDGLSQAAEFVETGLALPSSNSSSVTSATASLKKSVKNMF